MASIDIDIFPDPREIRTRHFSGGEPGGPFSILYVSPDVSIYISDYVVLDALLAALDKIRADMDAETAAVAS
jgi:hypothetical protein